MTPLTSDLNRSLWALLGLNVRDTGALTIDGAFLQVFIRDARGMAMPPPDFEHDLQATTQRLPPGVELRLKYSAQFRQWCCCLRPDYDIFEAFGETAAQAAAKALVKLLVAARAQAAVTP